MIQESSSVLPVMESFYTLQGEGQYTGHAAYFIRLGGCDVGCHWCDVKESWNADLHPKVSVRVLTEEARNSGSKIAVITGGEPLMHGLDDLTVSLQEVGIRTHIETSGTSSLSGQWDWITFSPKKFKKPLAEIYAAADELKIIVYNESDFDFALEHAAGMTKPNAKYLLQPEWSRFEEMMPKIVDFVKANPTWQVSLQTHKFMAIP